MRVLTKKIITFLCILIFLNLGFLIFALEVYFQLNILIPLLIFNSILCLDITIRPISSEKDHFKYSKLSIILFLLLPFIVIFPYLENYLISKRYLQIRDNDLVYRIGISLLVIGGIILIYSPLLWGKFGGSKITIESNHQLIIEGIYKYIRHPVYFGMLLVFFAFALSFKSLISPLIFLFSFFIIFKNRMDSEESILKEKFGKNYEIYINNTKRLFPFIY